MIVNALLLPSTQKQRCFAFFSSLPADDGSGVDLNGLLTLTGREQIISLLLHILTTLKNNTYTRTA